MKLVKLSPTLRQSVLLLLGLLFVPLCSILVMGFLAGRSESYRAAQDQVLASTRIALLSETHLIAKVEQTLFGLAQATQVRQGDSASCSAIMREFMVAGDIFADLGAADSSGTLDCGGLSPSLPSAHARLADRFYYRETIANGAFGIVSHHVGHVTGVPAITFGFPVIGANPSIVSRAVFGSVKLYQLSSHLRDPGLPANHRAWLFDQDGIVLASGPGDMWTGRSVMGSALGDAIMATGRGPMVTEVSDLDGVRRLYGISAIHSDSSDIRFRVAVGIPIADIFVGVNRTFGIALMLLFSCTAIVVLIAFGLLRRSVLLPIGALVNASRRLGANEVTARAPADSGIQEFALLVDGFNDMAASIEQRQARLLQHAEKLEQTGRRYKLLSAINRTIVDSADEDAMLGAACAAIVSHGTGRAAWIERFDATGAVTVVASTQDSVDEFVHALDRSSVGRRRYRVLRAREPVVRQLHMNGVDAWDTGTAEVDAEPVGYVGCPIMRGHDAYGVLNIVDGTEAVWFYPKGLALVAEITESVGLALVNFDKDNAIRQLAFFDSLTGLPNRIELLRQVDPVIKEAARTGATVPLIRFGLISLSQQVKRFGHRGGEYVIECIARALRDAVPVGALVARTEDNTFTVMLPPDHDRDTLPMRVEALVAGLPRWVTFGSRQIAVDFNVGVATFPEDGESGAALLQAGMLALDGLLEGRAGAIAFHSVKLSVQAQERWRIENLLSGAGGRGELFVLYQPTRHLASGKLLGVEALLRWSNEELGLVPPGRFIPIAEQAGLINELGYWVFEESCRQTQLWAHEGDGPAYTAINVSILQLYDPSFVRRIAALFDRFPQARGRVAIEITETAMMEDFEVSRRVLGELKDMGITVFVDDFGTGYSSLSYLHRLPVDTLKIDLAFTSQLGKNDEALSVVKAILALGKSLGLLTLAEGIETAEQRDILAAIGCDYGQGYFFAHPMAPEAISAMFIGEARARRQAT